MKSTSKTNKLHSKESSKAIFKNLTKNANIKQTEHEIFANLDNEGFNQNASEQHNYPGVQNHKPI